MEIVCSDNLYEERATCKIILYKEELFGMSCVNIFVCRDVFLLLKKASNLDKRFKAFEVILFFVFSGEELEGGFVFGVGEVFVFDGWF